MKNFSKPLLSLALLFLVNVVWGQIYLHDFGITTISTHPYTVTPTTFNPNLSSSSWSNSTGSWTSFAGSSGQAIALNNSGGTPTITLTFNVNVGFQLQIDSYSFWRQRSNTGAQNWSMTINANNVGSGTVPTTGANTGIITTGLPISGITGTVTIIISLSGASGTGTFRLDDFTLNGTVTPLAPLFSFSASTASVAENGGSINVVVNQSIAAVCNVNVVRVGGTATPGTEFTFTSPTTLNFDGVVTTQTINIPILDDLVSDGTKTIILELQSATGSCTIGSPSQLVISIIDNEPALPTILEPGDILIVGVDARAGLCEANANVDVIEWICFKTISAGTTIDFTDNGYSESTGNWRNAEGTVRATYTGTGIPAGTKIVFKTQTAGSLPTAPDWTFADLTTGFGSLALNSGGDQLYFMQGGTWNPGTSAGSDNASYTGGRFLFAFSTNAAWNDYAIPPYSSSKSQHSSLYPNMRCYSAAPTAATDWSRFDPVLATPDTQRIWIDKVKNPTNWKAYTSCSNWAAAPFPTTITINPGAMIDGRWLGGTSSNWFDCNNWDSFRVPIETTDVSIELTTGNNPTIDATAPFSDEFSDIAQAKNLTLQSSTTKVLTFPASGTHILEIYGNWDNQKGEAFFTEGNGTVRFRGNLNQTISTNGGVERFRNIVFNKTGGNITLSSTNVEISGTATFTNGTVNAPNATTARMEFLAGSSHTGASANSHVNGWVRKVGDTAFTFPVGDAGTYAPASISAPTDTDYHFTARYFKTSPHSLYNTGSLLSPLKNVSVCEYWIIDRTNGTSDVNVTLSYDNPRSCQTPDPAGLVVARWNGSQWVSEGQSAQTGTPTSGTITSNLVTSFSPFTLGNLTINPLPVELISFRGFVTTKGEAQLTWQVSAQSNIKGYAVEKSLDSKHFEQIGFVDAQNLTTYNFFDAKFAELSYYRLRIVETDGSYRYSQIISLDKNKTLTAQLLIYPNPAGEQDEIRVMIGGRDLASKLQAVVYGQSGKVLGEISASLQETEMQLSQLLATQPKGLYIIHLQTENGETLTAKFVKK